MLGPEVTTTGIIVVRMWTVRGEGIGEGYCCPLRSKGRARLRHGSCAGRLRPCGGRIAELGVSGVVVSYT